MLTFVAPSDGQLYKMKRTPFGLKSVMTNAIMLFEKELEVLTDRREWMVSYVDDLCVFHDDLDKHLFDLGRLLAVLTSINVKCKPSKTSIAQRECILFGYKLDEKGYTIDPKRLDSMLLIPKPSTRKQLIKVLGQASCYRSSLPPQTPMRYFTSHFRDLTSEKNPFEWTNGNDRVCDDFKSA